MKNSISVFVLFAVFCLSAAPLGAQDEDPFAPGPGEEEPVIPTATADYTHPFVKMLEEIEMRQYERTKHWRKGDYPPFFFLACDLDGNRARLSYIREDEKVEFYLAYFQEFNGKWYFQFNDVIFMPYVTADGRKPTLENALRTRNKRYWFAIDGIEENR